MSSSKRASIRPTSLLLGFLRRFRPVGGDLGAALVEALLRLGQLQHFDLQAAPTGSGVDALAQFLQALRGARQGRLGAHGAALASSASRPGRAAAADVLDFLLARQHAVLLGIGGICTLALLTTWPWRHEEAPSGSFARSAGGRRVVGV
jgi:hypothetical protein